MRKISLISIIFMMISFSVPSFGVEVSNYYVNGVANSREDADFSAINIEDSTSLTEVGVLYNSTFGGLSDVFEAGSQVFDWDGFYNSDGSVNHLNDLRAVWLEYQDSPNRSQDTDLAVATVAAMAQDLFSQEDPDVNSFFNTLFSEIVAGWSLTGFTQNSQMRIEGYYRYKEYLDLRYVHTNIEDIRKVVAAVSVQWTKPEHENHFSPFAQHYFDINNMLIQLDADRQEGRNVNLIAHSQGNLFANRLLDAFNSPDKVRLLSVATPDNTVYGDSQDDTEYVSLMEDLVATIFVGGALDRNISNYSPSEWAGMDFFNNPGLTSSNNSNKYVYIDLNGVEREDSSGHGFVSAYMHKNPNGSNSDSRNYIVNKIELNNIELANTTGGTYGCCGTGGEDISNDIEDLKFNDFYLTEMSLSETSVAPGETVDVDVKQHYRGTYSDSELPSVRVGYYCSLDDEFDNGDLYLDRDSSSLGSDDLYHREREELTIPSSGCSSGYILAVANYNDGIFETNKDDNVLAVEIEIGSGNSSNQGDLFIEDPWVSDTSMYVGQEYRLRAKHTYEGDQTTSQLGQVKMRYYVSDDTERSSDDEYLGYDYSTIGSNDTYDTESMYWTPSSSDRGLKYILFRADASDDVEESDEDNNYSWIAVVVY